MSSRRENTMVGAPTERERRRRAVRRRRNRAVHETDQSKRAEQFRQLRDLVMRDAPVVPLLQPLFHGMCGKDVGGLYVHPVFTLDLTHYWKTGG